MRERGERDRPTLGVPGGAGAGQPGGLGELDDLVRQPRLADAGPAREEDAAGTLLPEPRGQGLELAVAADQRPGRVRGSRRWRPRCVARTRLVLPHGSDEPVPPSVERLDHALRLTVIAHRPPGRLDPRRQRGLADEAVAPHVVEQVVLGDHSVAVLDEEREHAEDLRLHGNGRAGAPQLEPVGVEVECSEGIDHVRLAVPTPDVEPPDGDRTHGTMAAEVRRPLCPGTRPGRRAFGAPTGCSDRYHGLSSNESALNISNGSCRL